MQMKNINAHVEELLRVHDYYLLIAVIALVGIVTAVYQS